MLNATAHLSRFMATVCDLTDRIMCLHMRVSISICLMIQLYNCCFKFIESILTCDMANQGPVWRNVKHVACIAAPFVRYLVRSRSHFSFSFFS